MYTCLLLCPATQWCKGNVVSQFRSTPPSRANKAGLDYGPYVRTYGWTDVHMSVCLHPSTKSFPDSNEIRCVGRGRRVMHDVMPYDPIQGQGHETSKV